MLGTTLPLSTLVQFPMATPLPSTHAHLSHSRPPITPAVATHANLVFPNSFPCNTCEKKSCGRRADISVWQPTNRQQVSHLRRSTFSPTAYPGLTPWANFCRALQKTADTKSVPTALGRRRRARYPPRNGGRKQRVSYPYEQKNPAGGRVTKHGPRNTGHESRPTAQAGRVLNCELSTVNCRPGLPGVAQTFTLGYP